MSDWKKHSTVRVQAELGKCDRDMWVEQSSDCALGQNLHVSD